MSTRGPIYVGETVVMQFSVFNADGYTKKSGLVQPGNFTVKAWDNGATDAVKAAAVLATIAEDGATGEYRASASFASAHYWKIEIANTWNTDLMGEAYQVRAVVLAAVT